MAAVAKGTALAVFATAEIDCRRFRGFEFRWDKASTRMTSVAKGLLFAETTGAVVVALACFHLDWIRAILGDGWFGHIVLLLRAGGCYFWSISTSIVI